MFEKTLYILISLGFQNIFEFSYSQIKLVLEAVKEKQEMEAMTVAYGVAMLLGVEKKK